MRSTRGSAGGTARRWTMVAAALLLAACQSTAGGGSGGGSSSTSGSSAFGARAKVEVVPMVPVSSPARERDEIHSLLAYAVVYKNWQVMSPHRRGYNIGSVLVDDAGRVVCWGRNAVSSLRNGTQHGEVRLITNYLSRVEASKLREHTLYTTLEPCAMCSGMMTLQELPRTVWGQKDPDFGDALERLQFDSAAEGGYPPYPRAVVSDPAPGKIRPMIERAYQAAGGKGITSWLSSEDARVIYDQAWRELFNYRVRFAENKAVVRDALTFLGGVPDTPVSLADQPNCPPET